MHHIHLTCGISYLLHPVNLILFTVLLVHLILRISPHHSHHLCSHHHSVGLTVFHSIGLLSFSPYLKLITHLFHKPFPP